MRFLQGIVITIIMLLYGASLLSLAIPFATRDGLFVSPDEHATWTFAQEIAKTGIAAVQESRNTMLNGLLHPRSTVTVESAIVPAGFLGMPYVAGILYVLAPFAAALAGPFLGVLGLVALFFIVRQLGGSKEYAMLSTFALAVHPAWWYYSIRSLMPNVPFVTLVLCAVLGGLLARGIARNAYRLLAYAGVGMLFGAALFIRPSEWLWIGGVVIAAACVAPSIHTYKKEIAVMMVGFLGAAGIALFLQNAVYGGALTTGYTVDIPAWKVGGEIVSNTVAWYTKLFALLFPFGIHEKATLRNAWNYLVVVYPWMTILAGVGGIFFIKETIRAKIFAQKNWQFAGAAALCSAAYLVVLYGSWTFFDNPDPTVVSLGNSHVRYWLPLAVVSALLVAYALLRIKAIFLDWSQSDRSRMLARTVPTVGLMLIAMCSAQLVFFGDDGVMHTRSALQTFAQKRAEVLAATPENAVIIVDRADKYLWPHRAVVVPLRSEKTYDSIPGLLAAGPLYYFSITLPAEDLAHLHEVTFANTGITFTPIFTLQEETLYEIHLQ